MKKQLLFPKLMAVLLTIVALATGIAAHASDFTIEVDGNRFTIKRDNTTTQEKVYFRTVSQSALDGVHFTGKSGIAIFQVGDDSYPITINETAGSSLSDVYHYQTDASRTYRFEVLDTRGILLSYKNRTISYGNEYKVPTTQLNSSITDLIYFTDNGNFASGSGNKYLDVYNTNSQSGYTQVRDGGYSQGVHNIDVAPLFSSNDDLKNYFQNTLNCKMYATIGFTQKEENDGYQYIQILANNESTYDGTDSDGSVSTPSISLYKACFILSYSPSGSVMSDDHYQFFPHRYDYVDKATDISNGITHYEFDYDNSHLYKQAYRSTSFKATNSGSLVLPLTVNTLNVRFNAKGGGNDHDEWDFKNLFARLALVDETAPRQSANPVLNPGPYNVGSNFYVSVIFNEPVKYTTAPTLTTTWGTMTAMGGHGSNVLTFKGTISTSTTHGTALNVTALGGGTITDLAGNAYTGSVSQSFGSATAVARYNFDSSTSTLNLNWGPFSKNNKWGADVTPSAVTSVTATDEVSFSGDCSQMFYNFTNCTSIDLGQVDTKNCTNMGSMFYNCTSLTTLNVANWNTASVTNMSGMFYNCSSLTTLNVANWNTASVTNMSGMFYNCTSLTTLNVSGWNTAAVTNMSNLFRTCSRLTTLNVSGWNTAAVTNMSNLFRDCSRLTTLDVANWNTTAVTNMNYMFRGCSNLATLDVSGWNTGSVTNMVEMFFGCSSLTALDVSQWNTAGVTDMDGLFSGCSSLTALDLSQWNTAGVTDISRMFSGCRGMTTLDLSNWNTASVTNMVEMFYNCSSLTTIYAGSGWSTANVRNSSNMFSGCANLVGGMGTTYDSSNTDVAYARFDKGAEEPGYLTGVFTLTLPDDVTTTTTPTLVHGDVNLYAGGTDITLDYNGTPPDGTRFGHFTVDGEPVEGDTFVMPMAPAVVGVEYQARYTFDSETGTLTLNWGEFNKDNKWGNDVTPSTVTSVTATDEVSFTGDCSRMFYNFSNCTSIDLGLVNTNDCTDMSGMFYNCTSLTALNVANWNTASVNNMSNLFRACSHLTTLNVSGWNTASVTDFGFMFRGCSSLTTLDVSNWNTASVTNMGNMFRDCSNLTALDVSQWNTGSVTNMVEMFRDCSNLTALDVSQWNTASVTNMVEMFRGCSTLATLDVSEWDTSSVTSMGTMFRECSGLTTLDLSNWDTASVTDMSYMFYKCSGLTTLDVSEWNTASVTDMRYMFYDCSSLTTLDLSGWNTAAVTIMTDMFYNCSSLTTIYAGSGWRFAHFNEMFNGCSSLVGGMGTTYDPYHADGEYARFDRGEEEPGYLTGVFTLTLPDDVTTTTTPTLVHGDVNLYAGGTDITLAYNGTPPDGARFHHFTVDGEPVEGDTFAMPFDNSEVGVEYQARYTFDSATGTLTLNWGEYNKDNKWGNDVTPSAVTSVTATSDVSFTGNCYDLFYNFTNCTSMDLGDANTDALTSMFCMFYNCSSLTTLDLSNWNTASVTNMSYMFRGCSSLTTLDVSNWNTASVTNMSDMFDGCLRLTTLDVANWNTAAVTNMRNMFGGCESLESLDVSNWNTASVTNMSYMFGNCMVLTTLNVANWNTAAVTDMREMFSNCWDLTTLNVANWNTGSVTNMCGMFYGCESLTALDVSGWDTASVTDMSYMFYGCSSLTTLDVSGWNTASVTNMDKMFYGCSNLTTLDVSGWNTASVTNMDKMFYGCSNLTTIYAGSGWSTANVTNSSNMFEFCTSLVGGNGTTFNSGYINGDYARFDRGEDEPGYLTGVFALTLASDITATPAATLVHDDANLYKGGAEVTLTYGGDVPEGYGAFYTVNGTAIEGDTFEMPFEGASVTVEVKRLRYTFDSTTGELALLYGPFSAADKWGDDVTALAVTSVTATDEVSFTGDCTYLFHNFMNCTSIDLSNVNTEECTDMSGMFYFCKSLEALDVSGFDTSSVTGMQLMFAGCYNLTTIEGISDFDTSNVSDIQGMFVTCRSIEALDLSSWNTSSVTNMGDMFNQCANLTTLNLSGWDVSNATSMSTMFYSCSNLTTLDVTNWTIGSASMENIFLGCTGLTTLDLSTWNTASVTDMNGMFIQTNLTTIYVGEGWSTENVIDGGTLFYGSTNLVGGMGTTYDPDNYFIEYARMDHGDAEPGYLTGVFALTLADNVTASPDATLVHGDVNLYAAGHEVTLTYGGEVPEHKMAVFAVNDAAIEGDTFVMPFNDVTVTATVIDVPRYTFDSATGTLTLNWGEYNTGNKWGNDVTPSAVTSVTATSDVSFTGDCYDLFYNFTNCTSMDLGDANTDALTSMYCMFYGCSGLTTLDVSEWNTASVTNMSNMFRGCSSLTTLDVSNWNTASVTDMREMFYNCSGLESLDVSGWNTASATNMSNMFYGCSGLTTLDVSNWNTASATSMSYMFYGCSGLTTLDVSNWNTASVYNMDGLFRDCSSLASLDVSNWNTASATSMTYMFYGCSSLTTLDVSEWNTASVTNMGYMFYNCSSLTTLDVSNFDTGNVTSMFRMFHGCMGLTTLDVSNWNTERVTDMSGLFLYCSHLESLDVSGWDTSNVTQMSSMFMGMGLTTLDLSNWNTASVTNMSGMFHDCSSLESLDLSGWNTGNVTNMGNMFIDCSNLTTIYAGSGWSTAKLTAFSTAFPGCTSLVGGNGTTFDPSQITIEYARIDRDGEPGYLTGVFTLALPEGVTTTATPTLVHGDVNLYAGGTEVTIAYGGEVPEGKIVVYTVNGTDFVGDSFEMPYDDATVTVAVTDPPRYVFNRTTGTLTLYWGEFNKDDKWGDDVPAADVLSVTATDQVSFTGDCSQMFKDFSNCTSIDLSQVNTDDCTDMSEMFGNCKAVTTLDLSNWNTANVTNMNYMFAVCQSLESLDVSNWNTASVTDMHGMFIYCSALESLDILNFDIGKVTDMSNMFNNCSGLKSLDLSNWNTASVTTMNNMFIYCSTLESLDLSGWANSSVTDMSNMFLNCSSLETLDVSNWNTASVTNMSNMFNSCSGLTTLDLSSWNTAAVTTTYTMFVNCSNLTTIYAGAGWNTENITFSGGMFFNCTSLVGGNGTTYDPNHTDAEYAHFDGGVDNPGYLTGLFSITLPEDVEHGTLVASQGDKVLVTGDMVVTGSTVTLTVTPDSGYKLQSLTVTIAGGDDEPSGAPMRLRGGTVELTPGDSSDSYTFEMPAAPVEVNAVFKKNTPTDIDDINADKRNGQRYNLLGQPVGPDYKGVVIENGRKIYVE